MSAISLIRLWAHSPCSSAVPIPRGSKRSTTRTVFSVTSGARCSMTLTPWRTTPTSRATSVICTPGIAGWCHSASSLAARLEGDPDYYDAQIAGWWCWGMCCWIGSGWCSGNGSWQVVDGQLVKTEDQGGVRHKLPHLGDAGHGVQRQLTHLGEDATTSAMACTAWRPITTASIPGCVPCVTVCATCASPVAIGHGCWGRA